MNRTPPLASSLKLFLAVAVLFVLYLTSLYSFVLFHALVELFSIMIAAAIFILIWNFRPFFRDTFLFSIGVAYIAVGAIDLIHTLAYKGMGVFIGYDSNLPTQLWLAARYLQALALLIAPVFIGRQVRAEWLLVGYGSVSVLLLASIFSGIFPTAFVEGVGLTPFKIASEYIIILILIAAGFFLFRRRRELNPQAMRWMVLSLLFTIGGEMVFTSYITVYGIVNIVGHYLKVFAFYCIYKAIIETGAMSIYADVEKLIRTEKALRQSEANERARVTELEALMDAVPAVVWITHDPDSQVVTGNRASYDLLGLPPGGNQSLSAPAGEVTHNVRVYKDGKELAPHDLPLQRSAREGIALENYEETIAFEGQTRYLFGNVTPLLQPDGTPGGAVAAFVDISALKHAQAELEEYAARLEHSNQELEQFAFVASHDLQEPLRKVMAFSDRLHQLLEGRLSEQEIDYLERVMAATRRMQAMIDGLLAYSRVTTQAHPFERVDLGEIIEDVVSDLELRLERTGGRVTVRDIPSIEADPMQMRQLFQNLINNALKFHIPGVTPEIEITAPAGNGLRPNGRSLSIFVRDNGAGFEQENAERIFRPFERLHGRDVEGTGMGLAICSKIVERHGGKIHAESAPGAGATFIITLPRLQDRED